MSYIVGTSLPKHKTLIYAVTSIYGIGIYKSKSICKKGGFGLDCKVSDLSLKQLSFLESIIDFSVSLTGSDLRRFNYNKIRHLCDIVSYRGVRHRKGLPVRGQRTHTNSKRRVIFQWKHPI